MVRVLLIDDDPLFREATRLLLEAEGFEVAEAADGNSAIDIFRTSQDAVVLCDIFMWGKEGLETISDLRKTYPHAKIVAMSTGDNRLQMDVFKLALHLGANDAIRKPFDRATVRALLGRFNVNT